MKLNYKTVAASLALGCLLTSVANAAEPEKDVEATSNVDAILFRIENIAPIANKDGLIDQCSYTVTVYNRMDKGVRTADLQLDWEDNISAKYQVVDETIKVVGAKEAVTHVIKEMTIDDVAPHSQKSFEQKINTDKCYLLLDNLKYVVKSCFSEGTVAKNKNGKIDNKGDCAEKFNYIDSKNPEYYSEFKDVPDNILVKQAEEEKERALSKVNAAVDSIFSTLDDTDKELEKIK